MKKIIIIGVAVLLLAGIGVGAMLFLKEDPPADGDAAEAEAAAAAALEAVESVAEPIYTGLDPDFIVAFQNPKTARFLKLAIDVMAREDDIIEAVKLHMPAIRDSIVMLLSGTEEASLLTIEGKQQLRTDVLAAVQNVLEKNTGMPGIEAVYFTSFVMQ